MGRFLGVKKSVVLAALYGLHTTALGRAAHGARLDIAVAG